jgi:hypothetical protein|tara:strand:+ start:5386 stop:5562 length:177 start_codon:yes stop_codon:yes gene_type:complete
MIQKILITIFIFFIFIFGIRFLKKIKLFSIQNNKTKKNDDNIVDLEKDPNTNEYKPKE